MVLCGFFAGLLPTTLMGSSPPPFPKAGTETQRREGTCSQVTSVWQAAGSGLGLATVLQETALRWFQGKPEPGLARHRPDSDSLPISWKQLTAQWAGGRYSATAPRGDLWVRQLKGHFQP